MFASNERDAKAAYHRWLGQGPSGPYNMDLIERMRDEEGELLEHLAAFMFRQGVEFQKHIQQVDGEMAAVEAALVRDARGDAEFWKALERGDHLDVTKHPL